MGPYDVAKPTPQELFRAMLRHTATAGPTPEHIVPLPGQGDPRFTYETLPWDAGPGNENAYMKVPKMTGESAVSGSDQGGRMNENINSPRLKQKRAKKEKEYRERNWGAATRTHKPGAAPWEEE